MLTLKGWLIVVTIGLGIGAICDVPWCGSLLILEFIVVFGLLWIRTLANGIDRINGRAPDQLAVVRIAELTARDLDEDRDR
jgi:hypothetical protein